MPWDEDKDFQLDDHDWGDPFGFQTATEGESEDPPDQGGSTMSDAVAGVGTSFQRENDSSSGVYTAVAEVNSISGPGMTRDFIDVTSLDSTGGYREFIGGFRDGGQVTLNMNFTRDGYEQMRLDFTSDDSVNYQIVLPDTGATTLGFAAFVTDLPLSISPDDKITVDVTLKVTGEVTLTS